MGKGTLTPSRPAHLFRSRDFLTVKVFPVLLKSRFVGQIPKTSVYRKKKRLGYKCITQAPTRYVSMSIIIWLDTLLAQDGYKLGQVSGFAHPNCLFVKRFYVRRRLYRIYEEPWPVVCHECQRNKLNSRKKETAASLTNAWRLRSTERWLSW